MEAPLAEVVLRDGSTLTLRLARPEDEDGLRWLWDRMSEASRHFRFFTAAPADGIGTLLGRDGAHALTLVAETKGHLVALASYSRNPRHEDRADAAFVVADELQGHGVGTKLLEVLADAARAQGIRWFDADVLADNLRMLQVFSDSGLAMTQTLDAGVTRVSLSLARTPDVEAREARRARIAATASIRAVLAPRSVAVVGASRGRGKIGSEVLHNLVASGFTGRLCAVHPTARDIDGVPAWPTVRDIPGDPVDLAVVCVPAGQVHQVVEDAASSGVRGLVVITAGFSETGDDGRAREAAILDTVRGAGIRLVGPNCMGVLNTDPAVRLNATFSPIFPPAGNVAMSTQSGALGLAILDYARTLQIGISSFASIGNKADVSTNDLILYWADDPQTDVILMYVESFGNPIKFSQIARRVARQKPIVVVKAGRSAAGARAASSHTGALATDDVVVDALFRQAGVIRTTTIEELFDVTLLLANQPLPAGRRVAILTNAGGPGILAADACAAQGLEVAKVSDETTAALRQFLPDTASVGNPVDMIASASAAQYERALAALLTDEGVDSVLAIFIPPLVTRGEDVAAAIRRAAAAHAMKPVLAIFMSSHTAASMLAPIPCFQFPEAAAGALARAADYGDWRRAPERPPAAPEGVDTRTLRETTDAVLARGGGWFTAAEVDVLLAAVGIPRASARVVGSIDDAVAAATALGYPVVLKALGPDLVHKTDVQAVKLGLRSADAVRDAWRDLEARLGDRMTEGLVQEMVRGGAEMLVGAVQDANFGPVLMCATGGTLAELLADRQVRLAPLSREDAAGMVAGLRGAILLRGYRGMPRLDEAALVDTLIRLSAIVRRCPEIREIEINPVIVLPTGARAVDARVRVAPLPPPSPSRRIRW
jgi:acetyl coenzyme A synthetase (ADP forming)-like protein